MKTELLYVVLAVLKNPNKENIKMESTTSKEVKEFIDIDIENVLNIYLHTKTGGIHMNSGPLTAMADCIETCRGYLNNLVVMLDDSNDQIRYLKEHATGWDNDMRR